MSVTPISSVRPSTARVLLSQAAQLVPPARNQDQNVASSPILDHYESGAELDGFFSTITTQLDATAMVTARSLGVADGSARLEALADASSRIGARDFDGAKNALKTVFDQDPNDSSALRLNGRIALAEQDYKTAEQTFSRAVALEGGNPANDPDVRVARTLQQDDDSVLSRARAMLVSPAHRQQALDLLVHVSARSPENADAAIALAEAYNVSRRPELAVSSLDNALRSADAEQAGRVVADAAEIVRRQPGSAFAKNVLGRALTRTGDLDGGIENLRAALDLAPTDPSFAADLANAFVARSRDSLDRGATDSARADLAAAYAADQFNPDVQSLTARVAATDARDAVFRGRFNKALTRLATARRNAPNDAPFRKELADLYIQVGEHFEQTGGTTQALDNFSAALDLDPGSTHAKRKVAELSHTKGVAALNAGDFDRAITFLQTAFNTDRPDTTNQSDLARAFDLRGERFRASGKFSEAVADLTRAVELDPANAQFGSHLALAVQSNGI